MSSEIRYLINSLQISDKHTIGDIMSYRGKWKPGTSASNNSYKYLKELADLGELVQGKGYFKIPTCKSEYGEHAQLLTKALAKLFKTPYEPIIFREKTIQEVGLRPDAIVLLKNGNKGRCFVLEVVNNELPIYLEHKKNIWKSWGEDLNYLSKLFGFKIPYYDFITSETLDSYLEEL